MPDSLRDAFVGIDVAFAKNKRLPICMVVIDNGRLTPLALRNDTDSLPPLGSGNVASLEKKVRDEFAHEVLGYVHSVAKAHSLRIRRIALDAPSSFKMDGIPRRLAEAAMDERRISCFATPSQSEFDVIIKKARHHLANGGTDSTLPHANQLWMLVGFSLFETLSKEFECLEVYPQATAHVLEASSFHKTTLEGHSDQVVAVASATGWSDDVSGFEAAVEKSGYGAGHDKLDAFMSAWIASLDEKDRTACGQTPDDAIWIPNLSQAIKEDEVKQQKPHSNYTGLAGEFFVAAELLKRGFLALVTMGNTKRIDIIATNSEGTKTVRIQVKTERIKKHKWVLGEKHENDYADDLFYVFVSLGKDGEHPDFFVVPSTVVARSIADNHKQWLSMPGRHGAAHKDNPMRQFVDSASYKDAWSTLGL